MLVVSAWFRNSYQEVQDGCIYNYRTQNCRRQDSDSKLNLRSAEIKFVNFVTTDFMGAEFSVNLCDNNPYGKE